MSEWKTLHEHKVAGDGIMAPGAYVLRERIPDGNNHFDWYSTHFRNDQTGGYGGGTYHNNPGEAKRAFAKRAGFDSFDDYVKSQKVRGEL